MNLKGTTLAWLTSQFQAPAVRPDYLPNVVEPQPEALHVMRVSRRYPEELPKNSFLMFRSNAHTVVTH